MTVNFTAFEIFEIAEQIERNGAKFYRDAATISADKSIQRFFLQLAAMEDNHEKIFAQMRQNLQDETDDTKVFDPNNEMVYYLKAMAKSAGWEGKAASRVEFTGSETPVQIIKTAIQAEKASIDYYLGLKEFVSSQTGKNKVDGIIKEEMGHVVTLQKHLEQLGS
ncbi:MAG: ferritin family protein [Phycisphaerae bacterium]|nr:ferritin family protein [Phycisphaerae bacterium]